MCHRMSCLYPPSTHLVYYYSHLKREFPASLRRHKLHLKDEGDANTAVGVILLLPAADVHVLLGELVGVPNARVEDETALEVDGEHVVLGAADEGGRYHHQRVLQILVLLLVEQVGENRRLALVVLLGGVAKIGGAHRELVAVLLQERARLLDLRHKGLLENMVRERDVGLGHGVRERAAEAVRVLVRKEDVRDVGVALVTILNLHKYNGCYKDILYTDRIQKKYTPRDRRISLRTQFLGEAS